MTHFFSVYKALGRRTAVDEVRGREAALKIIERSMDRYIECYCK